MAQNGTHESIRSKTIVWFSYFVILLCCALPHGIQTPVDAIGFNTSDITEVPRMAKLADLVKLYGQGDAGIYATMATHLGQGQFTEYEYWRLRLFAPGNVAIEAACLKLFGPDFPIVLFCTLIVCALWASVLFNIRAVGNYKRFPIWCFITPLTLCFLGIFARHFLNRGVVLSESMSTAALTLGYIYTLRAIRDQRSKFATMGGLFLALAAYMRAQNELVCLALTIASVATGIALFAWHSLQRMQGKKNVSFIDFAKGIPVLTSMAIALTVFNALTIPYRCWNVVQYHSASWLQWDHYWEANWRDENLMRTRDHDQGLIDAGETVAGRVDPELAASIQKEVNVKGPFAFPDDYYKRNSIMTFITHPYRWLVLKSPAIRRAWKDGTTELITSSPAHTLYLEHILYLFTLAFCVVRFFFISVFKKGLQGEELWNFLFFSALLGANVLTTIFIHLEPRYYYTLKTVSAVLFLVFALSKLTNRVQQNQ